MYNKKHSKWLQCWSLTYPPISKFFSNFLIFLTWQDPLFMWLWGKLFWCVRKGQCSGWTVIYPVTIIHQVSCIQIYQVFYKSIPICYLTLDETQPQIKLVIRSRKRFLWRWSNNGSRSDVFSWQPSPAKTRHWANGGLMLAHRIWRWSSNNLTLTRRLVFVEMLLWMP